MKTIKNTLLATVVAVTGLLSVNAQADKVPVIYASQDFSGGITVRVYHEGEPLSDAVVKVFGSGSNLREESQTNQYGIARFTHISGAGPVKVIAETAEGISAARKVYLNRGGDRW